MTTGGDDDPDRMTPSQIAFPSSKPTSDGYIDYYVGERKDEPETGDPESTQQVQIEGDDGPPSRKKKKSKKGLILFLLLLLVGAGAVFAPKELLEKLKGGGEPPAPEIKIHVTSEPESDVYRGESLLGRTPLTVIQESEQDVLILKQQGFEEEVVTFSGASPETVLEVHKKLTPTAVVLDWSKAPEGARYWWNGEEKTPAELSESPPVPVELKVEPSDGAAVVLQLDLSKESSPLSLGPLIFAELAKRPRLNLSLALPDVFATEELTLTISRGEWKREQKLTLEGGRVLLPEGGTYEVAFAGSDKLKAFTKKVILNESGILDLPIEAEGVNGEKPIPKTAPTPSPTPAATATPSISPTPEASATPSVTPTPKVAVSPTPSVSATPSVRPTPAKTPIVGSTPTTQATPLARPSATPAPVATHPPKPKPTPKPVATPKPKPKPPTVSTQPATPPPVYRPPPRRYVPPPPRPRPPTTGGARITPPEF